MIWMLGQMCMCSGMITGSACEDEVSINSKWYQEPRLRWFLEARSTQRCTIPSSDISSFWLKTYASRISLEGSSIGDFDQGFEGLRLSSFTRVLGFVKGAQGDREAEVFQVSNDDTAVVKRRLEDK
nr:hypothetical protein [Tanacetum cinerariifolium]